MWFLLIFLILTGSAYGQTYNDDYALMTEINRQRILHAVQNSMIVNHDLHQSTRVLAQNHAYFLCDELHKTCQGESFERRLNRFYPDHRDIAEVRALGYDVQSIVQDLIKSPIDSSTILGNYTEMGAALIARDLIFGSIGEAIINVGNRNVYPKDIPVITGAVYDGYAWLTYDATKPPKAAFVTLGKKDYSLKFYEGEPNYGVYRVPIKWPAGCERITFTVLSDYDIPIVFPNPLWENNIGDLCFDTPPLLNKVRIRINSSGNRMFRGNLAINLETLPNQHPKSLILIYGKNGFLELPTEPFLRHNSHSTKLRGTFKSKTVPRAEPGRVNVYLDYKLVASITPRRTQQNYIEVGR